MAQETIDEILMRKHAAKNAAASSEAPPAPVESTGDKFFGVLVGEGTEEHFLELQNRTGLRTCFPYSAIAWIVYDAEVGISLDMGGYLVVIKGRGLVPGLFDGIRRKRVAWVKEADHELQDHKDNDIFISEIYIEPPKEFGEGEAEPAE